MHSTGSCNQENKCVVNFDRAHSADWFTLLLLYAYILPAQLPVLGTSIRCYVTVRR